MGWMNSVKKAVNNVNVFKSLQEVKKQLRIAMTGILKLPSGLHHTANVHLYPKFLFGIHQLYDFAYNSDVLTITHNALRRELFRNGFELIESQNLSGEQTSSEEEEPKINRSREDILEFLERVNENNQSITEVFYELEDDFSIMDDAFMVFIFEYEFNNQGFISKKSLQQIKRADPRFTGPIINRYDRPGFDDEDQPLFVCPEHRDVLITNSKQCSQCNLVCQPAHYFTDYASSKLYYFENEVIFKSKYRPSKRRGFPPILTVWQKSRTLMFMDKYIMELYDGQRPPKAGLFFKTSNMDSLTAAWKEAQQQADENPHLPVVMGVPDDSSGHGFVEFIDFMKGLDELQHTDMRNEFRRQIGAFYGVEPIFQGDISASGGLNNEGLQLTVTTRATEYGQRIYNTSYWPKILEAMGVIGWIAQWRPSEEMDEAAKLERIALSLQNGQMAMSLGLTAEWDDKSGEVIIESGPLESIEPTTDPIGGDGGFDFEFSPTGSPSITELSNKQFMLALKAASQRPSFTQMSAVLKREIDKLLKTYKVAPTESELSITAAKINLLLQKSMIESSSVLFKKTYKKELSRVSNELGTTIKFNVVDENALKVLSQQKVLSKAYAGISNDLVSKINSVIRSAYHTPGGLSLNKITEEISDLAKVSDFKAERIARTEMSRVSSFARKNSYFKQEGSDSFKFRHIGPNDNRTTSTSKNIKSRTSNGVSWSEYVAIVVDESAKEFPSFIVDKDAPISHWNTRHSFVRVT